MNAREFGILIRNGRKALGMTQRDLALVINAGERFIVELEAGKDSSHLGKALAAAQAVGVHIQAPTTGAAHPHVAPAVPLADQNTIRPGHPVHP